MVKLIEYFYIFSSLILSMPYLSLDDRLHLSRHGLVEVFYVVLGDTPPNLARNFFESINMWVVT